MTRADYKCEDCENIWEYVKTEGDFPKNPKCPKCESKNTYRKWSAIRFDVAEGALGNAKNGYTSGVTYHSSRFTPDTKHLKRRDSLKI